MKGEEEEEVKIQASEAKFLRFSNSELSIFADDVAKRFAKARKMYKTVSFSISKVYAVEFEHLSPTRSIQGIRSLYNRSGTVCFLISTRSLDKRRATRAKRI